MASFRKRGPYQWQAIVRKKGYPQKTKTFESKAEAVIWARDTERSMDLRKWIDPSFAEKTSLKECIERYVAEITPTKKGAIQEEMKARVILRHPIALKPMSAVRSSDTTEYKNFRLKQGKSNSTVRLELMLLSHVFNTARREWGMETISNPIELTKIPPPGKSRKRRLEEGEEERMYTALADIPTVLTMAKLAVETGMRQGEIKELEWAQIDWKER